jgi:ComF family protein
MPTTNGNVCGACLSHPPRFDAITAAFIYDWPLAPLIQQYKYAGNLALAQVFAHALEAKVTGAVDLIIPMPLAPSRLAERGFNQALEIARIVSRIRRTALAPTACRRVRESAPQATLPWKERARNIRGAFVCDRDLSGACVAIVDDVLTTGATLNELARNLRKAGAIEIQGWVVARTIKPD